MDFCGEWRGFGVLIGIIPIVFIVFVSFSWVVGSPMLVFDSFSASFGYDIIVFPVGGGNFLVFWGNMWQKCFILEQQAEV